MYLSKLFSGLLIFHSYNTFFSIIVLLLSLVPIDSPLDKWEELNPNPERNGNRKWKLERQRSSKNSSNEFLW